LSANRTRSIKARNTGRRRAESGNKMPGAQWFLRSSLELLREPATPPRRGRCDRVLGRRPGAPTASYHELYDDVSRVAQALRAAGLKPGDRVAGFVANMPEAVIAMLAATSLGATWCSCSPDFGVRGVVGDQGAQRSSKHVEWRRSSSPVYPGRSRSAYARQATGPAGIGADRNPLSGPVECTIGNT
jgi:hypothetical protein